MDIKVTVNPYENEKTNLLGYANVVFDDKYALENIKIKTGTHGRYVELPKYSVPKKNEDGSLVLNIYGKPEYERKDIFHPFSTEANKKFSEMILTEYKNVVDNGGTKSYYAKERGNIYKLEGDFSISRVTAGIHEQKNVDDRVCGIATVGFGNTFMLEKVKIKVNTDNELYIDLPKYRTPAKDDNNQFILNAAGEQTYKYEDAFHPITSDERNTLKNAVLSTYHEKLAQKLQNDKSNTQSNHTDRITSDGIPLDDFYREESYGRR